METGKAVRKVKQQTKYKYKRKLKAKQKKYAEGKMELADVKQVLLSYQAHLSHGYTYKLRKKVLAGFVLRRGE